MPKRFRFTPDWSGNPFCFFFKNKKIGAQSGKMDWKMPVPFGSNKKGFGTAANV
jgi:hypothetical protein